MFKELMYGFAEQNNRYNQWEIISEEFLFDYVDSHHVMATTKVFTASSKPCIKPN